jgi:hypothetical protein
MIGPSQRPLPDNNTHKRQASMPTAGFELTIPANERPQTHALDSEAIGSSMVYIDILRTGCLSLSFSVIKENLLTEWRVQQVVTLLWIWVILSFLISFILENLRLPLATDMVI